MKTHTLMSTAAVALVISSGAFAQSQRSEQREPSGSKVERIQDANGQKAGQAQNQQPGSNRELNGRNVRTVYPNKQNAQSPAAPNAAGQSQSGASAQNQGATQPSQNAQTQDNAQSAQRNAQPSTAQQNKQPPATAQHQPSSQTSGSAQSRQSTTSQQVQPAASTNTQQPSQQARQPDGSTQQGIQQSNNRQSTSGVVSLSAQQQTRIGQTIAHHNVKSITNVNFSISIGTQVPRSVQLRALPSDLVTFVPQYRGYSYFVVEEQIVIVEPSSHEIVAVMPYTGSTRTAAPRDGAMASRSVKLDSGQRDVIRKHVTREHKPAERSVVTSRKHYSVGEQVPRSVTIESFPETVYTEVPTVRRYRYFRDDDDVMLVDPEDDRIVDIIR
jgi:hypothetical protein